MADVSQESNQDSLPISSEKLYNVSYTPVPSTAVPSPVSSTASFRPAARIIQPPTAVCGYEDNAHRSYNTSSKNSERMKHAVIIVTALLSILSLVGICVGATVYASASNIYSGAFWAYTPVIFTVLCTVFGISTKKSHGEVLLFLSFIFSGGAIISLFSGAAIDGSMAYSMNGVDFSKCQYTDRELDFTEHCDHLLWKVCEFSYPEKTCYCCDVIDTALILEESTIHCRWHGHTSPDNTDDPLGISRASRPPSNSSYLQTLRDKIGSAPLHYSGVPSCDYVGETFRPLHWVSVGCCTGVLIVLIVQLALTGTYTFTTQNARSIRNAQEGSVSTDYSPTAVTVTDGSVTLVQIRDQDGLQNTRTQP